MHGIALAALLAIFALAGCQAPMRHTPSYLLEQGEFGAARQAIRSNLTKDRSDRQYLLDRMKLGIITLADGYPSAAQVTFEEVYDVLRTQGINKDRAVQSVVFYEGVKIWKGEPFEQALALAYYSAQQASMGQWDNARAAAASSLFQLRDFRSESERKNPNRVIDSAEVARRAAAYENQGNAAGRKDAGEQFLNSGYAVRESNFTLGYLLTAVASQQLGREQEANDYLAVAQQIDPSLTPLLQALKSGQYNTLLLVSAGRGPRKEAYGPDNALARFVPMSPGDSRPLLVRLQPVGQVLGDPPIAFPVVCNVNRMAVDHMWNNLEDVRKAKAIIGQGMTVAGMGALAYGLSSNDASTQQAAALVGLGMMAAGTMMRAGAHADTRYCDVMPQRMYLVPLQVDRPGLAVQMEIQGSPGSRIVLTGLTPPPQGQKAQLRYVRLVTPASLQSIAPPPWLVSGRVLYSNDYGPADSSERLANVPYILGGHSVRTPSEQALDDAQQAGVLRDYTAARLRELYRSEGIITSVEDDEGTTGLHVLEGGKSLVAPLPGTTGYARLFGQVHPPYQPRSAAVRQAAKEIEPLQPARSAAQ